MRILIVSTPKTGNTWVRELLAHVYDLPVTTAVPREFDEADFDRLGQRWVGHQHLDPRPDLIRWARVNGVIFVTTVRHPADVLVSLCNYVLTMGSDAMVGEALRRDEGTLGNHVTAYVRDAYFVLVNQSVSWLRTGISHIARYEDFSREPEIALTRLTDAIQKVSLKAVENAVRECSFESMKQRATDKERPFFRSGGTDNWRDVLPAEIVRILANVDPYPAQFGALGYRMDPWEETKAEGSADLPKQNRIGRATEFDNGVPISAIIADCYSTLPAELRGRWDHPEKTGGVDSFIAWLNSPCRLPGDAEWDAAPVLTNLAAYIYLSRGGSQGRFPRLNPLDPVRFCMWYIVHAEACFDLAASFVRPVRKKFRRWATSFSADSIPPQEPRLTNLAHYIYHTRPDLRQDYSTLDGDSRIGYARWFIHHARREYALDRRILKSISRGYYRWANKPSASDTCSDSSFPMVTNLGAYLQRLRPDLQERFPDPYGQDRIRFALWFTHRYRITEKGASRCVVPVVRSWAEASQPQLSSESSPKPHAQKQAPGPEAPGNRVLAR